MSRIGPESLGHLFDLHAPALVLYARQWSATPEDVVQDAFIALARQRVAPDQVLAWLYRVVRNAALASSRRDRRRQQREAKVADDRSTWFSQVDDQLDARQAQALLADLDPAVRSVIIARIWGGLTFDAIAQAEGCSVTTAHRRYQAGLAQLHERLAAHEPAR